jgi:hypothetical protein
MVSSAADLKAAFPTVILTPVGTLSDPPTYATIRQIQVELNGNARSVHSNGGDGILGHLALTLPPAKYNALSAGNVPFVPPVNPPPSPVHPAQATAPQISEANRQHLVNQDVFRTYNNVDAALRSQLIAATPAPYLAAIRDADLGFGGLSCLNILTHLHTAYAIITAQDLEDNLARMTAPWNPPTPLEILFTQIDDGALYADAGGDPVSDAFKARKLAAILFNSARFPINHREWRAKAPNEQTYSNAKIHFRKADLDRRKLEMTSGSAGYHGGTANQAEIDSTFTENAMLRALLCQTAPHGADESSVAAMTAISALQASQATQHEQLTALIASNTITSNTQARKQTFCWTHGCSSNTRHTSMSCRNRAEGHQELSTIDNKMGGSEKIWNAPRAPRSSA